MQGDGAAFIGYPKTGQTVTQFLEAQGLVNASVADAIAKSDLFPQPNTGNTTLDVFNVTQRITTDIMFRCLDQATVEASVVNNVFPVNYVYEFDRSYQVHFLHQDTLQSLLLTGRDESDSWIQSKCASLHSPSARRLPER